MDTKNLTVKAITLLYLSTKVKDLPNSDDIHTIVQNVIKVTKPKDRMGRSELSYDVGAQLRDCLIQLKDESATGSFNEDELKQRFEMIAGDDSRTYKALNSMLITPEVIKQYENNPDTEENLEDRIRKRISTEYWNVKRILEQEEIARVAYEWSMKLGYHPETINWETLIEDLGESFNQFSSLTAKAKDIRDDPAVIDYIDFSDAESVGKMLDDAKERMSGDGVLVTGYQGINRMLGEVGGFRRGETVLIGALRYNYKSSFSRDIFVSIPLFNKPYMLDPSKTPLNLRLSLEDDGDRDTTGIYRRLLQVIDKQDKKPSEIDSLTASAYIEEKLSVNGYKSIVISADSSKMSYEKIVNTIEYFEAKGYEIHHLNIDYLAMITKDGSTNTDSLTNIIQSLFTRLRNVCRRKRILLTTPHQLGYEAKQMQLQGVANFVKKVAGMSQYDACRRIDQEVDTEITIHIEKSEGVSYLTCARGKHRGVDNTPQVDQYCVYKFDPVLGLPMDYNGDDQSRRTVGADEAAEGGSLPLWEVENEFSN